jgi:hypothetical protein
MLVAETFDTGPGVFQLGSNAQYMEARSCGCIRIDKNKDTSVAIVEIDVTSKERIEIVFDFYSDGLKDEEEIILEFAAGYRGWGRIQSWTKSENSFPDGRWVSTSTSWRVTNFSTLQLRFRSTSDKRRFYIDNVMIRGK